MAELNPSADFILIGISEEDEKVGDLFIPESAKKTRQHATVIAVGPGRMTDNGRIPMDSKVGDIVVYLPRSVVPIEVDNEEYTLIRDADVIARVG